MTVICEVTQDSGKTRSYKPLHRTYNVITRPFSSVMELHCSETIHKRLYKEQNKYSRPSLGSNQPTVQGVSGALAPRGEADHSLPSNINFKNEQSCMSAPPIRLHGVVSN
jgi:hypothetical protein